MMPPSGFSTSPQIPNNFTSERSPMITIVFAATTPKNMPFGYHASTLTNPNPMINTYEDLRTELEYFSEDYDEEQEMEPRPEPNREAALTLRPRSLVVRRQRESVVGFKEAPNMEGSRRGRNAEDTYEDLRTELEYFSEDYDEEQEMEPRPEPNREAALTLRPRSLVVRRQRESVVGFKEAPNMEGSRRGRNAEVRKRSSQRHIWRFTTSSKEKVKAPGPSLPDTLTILYRFRVYKLYTKSSYNPREPKEEQRATSEEHQEEVKGILSCVDIEERIVINDQYPKQTIAIGRQLPTKTKIRLHDLLRTYVDVFAWTTAHMTRVPRTLTIGGETFNTEHRINDLKHLVPVKQKKRSLTPERNEAIQTQVEELTKANILREVKYQTWISNPFIVKKASGRWKLCADFTDINKAYPKEQHSLPKIEQKVEDLRMHRLKCFLAAYKGYHQIPIAKKDKEKIAFYTREGVFCYRRLTFGLKNTGATYQILIDKVINH
nr:reverse transcriptase domain-containing protein [Tanacetum cinerariifolium]